MGRTTLAIAMLGVGRYAEMTLRCRISDVNAFRHRVRPRTRRQ